MDGLRSRANDRAGIKVKEPKSLEQREEVASECARSMRLSIPFLIDNMDNKTCKDYGTWPDRIYIVGKDKLDRQKTPERIVIDVRDLTLSLTDFPGPRFTLDGGMLIDAQDPGNGGLANQAHVTDGATIRAFLRQTIGEAADDVVLIGE